MIGKGRGTEQTCPMVRISIYWTMVRAKSIRVMSKYKDSYWGIGYWEIGQRTNNRYTNNQIKDSFAYIVLC